MKIKTMFLLSLLCLLIAACAPQYGANWVKISEGGFSAMFPATPTKTRKENSATTFRLEHNDELYILSYNLMTTPDENKIEQSLDMVRNGFVNSITDGTLLEEKRIKVDGFAGRELVVDAPKLNQVIRQKMILVNSILYQYGVSTPKEKQITQDAQMYLDSFEIKSK